jgi:hypothetical protein
LFTIRQIKFFHFIKKYNELLLIIKVKSINIFIETKDHGIFITIDYQAKIIYRDITQFKIINKMLVKITNNGIIIISKFKLSNL